MTNDRIWETASLGERLDILKARVDRLDVQRGYPVSFYGATFEDIERWRRIEEAAAYVERCWSRRSLFDDEVTGRSLALGNLREALQS